ncbi:MAG: DEAD/DEAH box helicase family protein, partial [Anaerolineaceae bacterium]|nr:DEAD/DEAH box helicase family protein [Anaerolineaceae bacterium]
MSNGLAEFQMQAVARIVERFNDPQGSRRFLLADEVGLGKTRVAAGVIEALRKRKGFIVIYVCSNAEIAEQNRDKLAPGAKAASVTRLSLLALDSKKIKKDLSHGELRIFSFTPGTSFQVRRSTGVVRERRLLLFLLWRVWRMPVGQARWREFFRCTAGIEDWMASTHFKQLCHEFAFQISADLQNELKKAWNSCLVESGPGTGRPHQESQPLADALRSAVEVFYKRPNAIARANRNRIIGTLRECLSKVALQFLKPDLVLLDEFQKFPEILKESQNSETIIGCLFRNRNTPALILSATPYKMYSLNYEDAKHRDELLNTLAFLHGHRAGSNPADAHEVKNIVEKLDAFKAALLGGEWFNKANPDLLKLRKDIENLLKPVMCRTERYWYIADEMKGVKESGDAPDQLPSPGELEQYVRLRQFLLKQKIDDWNITDFWKSAPLPLVFMDGDYALIKRLRHRRFQTVPPQLLPSGPSLTIACRDNLKVQNLVNEVLPAGRQFKYLWVKPAYCYECDREKDDFFADGGPVKMLVFSHWKFVPKAIAVILSHEAEQRIDPPRRRRKEKSPLQFRQIISFTSFDVCYPSPVLAGCVNPAAWAREAGRPLLPEKVNERAEQAVRELLLQPANKIEIRDNVRSAPLWRIVARLESVSADVDIVLLGLASSGLEKGDERSAHYDRHRTRYEAYLEDNEETLAISHKWVRRLAQIALYSPAICLLRSMQSVFGRRKWEQQHWAALLSLGINQMRNYFNKRIVQMVIRSQRMAERSYAAQVLSYCQRAQLQAVLDEYAYVLMESLTAKKTEDLPREFLRHLSTVFGIGSGSPSVNQLTKTGHVKRRPMPRPSHFALAFGDDILVKDKAQMKRSRKTAMREAFNSPFWPFVLATTSVGQEGLDFHLYCRDVMHWNLPSNPVDLEQREGRINRR